MTSPAAETPNADTTAVVLADPVGAAPPADSPPAVAVTELETLHRRLSVLAAFLLAGVSDRTPAERATLLVPIQQQITRLRPAIDAFVPAALGLLRGQPQSLNDVDRLVDDAMAAQLQLVNLLRELGQESYQRRAPAAWDR